MQRPHPPICVGGSGEAQETLRTAARFAQHWNFVRWRAGGVRPRAATSCVGTVRTSAATRRRFCSPAHTFPSPVTPRPARRAGRRAGRGGRRTGHDVLLSDHPLTPASSSRLPTPCVSSDETRNQNTAARSSRGVKLSPRQRVDSGHRRPPVVLMCQDIGDRRGKGCSCGHGPIPDRNGARGRNRTRATSSLQVKCSTN